MPIHITPVFIAIDTTSAAVSRPAGDPQMSASESDADGDSEEKVALGAPLRSPPGDGFFM